jgi:hypothetical protein
MHRDYPGYDDVGRYVNTTGRNDFVLLKVAADDAHVFFYAETAEPVTSHRDPYWMQLFINADDDLGTGWVGYDLRVNGAAGGATESMLERARPDGTWAPDGPAACRVRGRQMELAVPRTVFAGPDTDSAKRSLLRFSFKWADNASRENDVMAFTINGDAAPNARFQYRFEMRP